MKADLVNQQLGIEKLLLARVREVITTSINRRLSRSYAPVLDIQRPRGFGEVFNRRFTIHTPARTRLEFMLKNMPGGSIGIAGSRGAGKTTLLKLFCGPNRIVDRLNDKPVLGVLVSAPVAYKAREFILYLFSSVCQNVIVLEGGKSTPPDAPVDAPPADRLNSPSAAVVRSIAPMLVRVGIWLTLASIPLGVGLAALNQESPTKVTQSAPNGSPTPNAAAAATRPSPAAATQPPSSPSPAATKEPEGAQSKAFFAQLAKELKLDAGALLGWGSTFILTGLAAALLLQMSAWRTFSYCFAQVVRSVSFPPFRAGASRYVESQRLRMENARARLAKANAKPPAEGEAPPADPGSLREQAERWLRSIKFQQSYTTGWSGALKLPVGFEGSVNRAVTLAQNQLSLPEVVQSLAQFLEEISRKYQVIIGIDELDKLSSDALAHRFLNDIKSIFGIERCFYLISVSEQAMSNFERRGLPFRDVFDSSFDDFVYVEHLDFALAQGLLEQRVVGRPVAFFGMSYCMSGGLARDLVRNFRSVLEEREKKPKANKLADICGQIVRIDLIAKVRAMTISARKIALDPEVDQFVEQLYALEANVDSDVEVGKIAHALLNRPAPTPPPASQLVNSHADKARQAKLEQLAELSDELGSYIRFALTMRQFFNNNLDEDKLTKAPPEGTLDRLARARQILGVNSGTSRALVDSFRAAHQLPPF